MEVFSACLIFFTIQSQKEKVVIYNPDLRTEENNRRHHLTAHTSPKQTLLIVSYFIVVSNYLVSLYLSLSYV